jgi:hypothetical protein
LILTHTVLTTKLIIDEIKEKEKKKSSSRFGTCLRFSGEVIEPFVEKIKELTYHTAEIEQELLVEKNASISQLQRPQDDDGPSSLPFLFDTTTSVHGCDYKKFLSRNRFINFPFNQDEL